MTDPVWNRLSRTLHAIAVPVALFLVSVALPAIALAQRGQVAPEAASGFAQKSLVHAKRHMVVAANPYAVETGRDILRAGGSAVDAAIAVQLILNIVEPQSSGIGGGAFLLHFDAKSKAITTYDGRETAPAAARPERFLKGGRPIPFGEAVHSGLSVGVPGALAMLEMVHARHGRLPWARLFEPAIALANEGFLVSPRLSLLLDQQGEEDFNPAARRYFFDAAGVAWPPGQRLINPEFAMTLKGIATQGTSAFYTGPVAEAMVRTVAGASNHAGDLTLDDLAAYRAKERPPVCADYRGRRVCGMGPPSSGGLAIAQALKLLEPFEVGGATSAMGARALHLIVEAEKLAYADRDRYVADGDFAAVPTGLLDPAYIAARRALIDPLAAAERRPSAGTPPSLPKVSYGADATREAAGTSHISIIDGEGNAVAMTTTIESAFGSGLWAAGFLLNNQMTDFSFRPRAANGRLIANRVEPGKRPRSSMAPTIVLDEQGQPLAVLGSPGGSRIILYVLKTLVALVDWRLDAQTAVSLENFGSRGAAYELEMPSWSGPASLWHALKVKPYGHRIAFDEMTSGLHVIVRHPDGALEGGVDPRREGLALGD